MSPSSDAPIASSKLRPASLLTASTRYLEKVTQAFAGVEARDGKNILSERGRKHGFAFVLSKFIGHRKSAPDRHNF